MAGDKFSHAPAAPVPTKGAFVHGLLCPQALTVANNNRTKTLLYLLSRRRRGHGVVFA